MHIMSNGVVKNFKTIIKVTLKKQQQTDEAMMRLYLFHHFHTKRKNKANNQTLLK